MFDLDNFKYYNDRYGHQAGDKLLRKVAETVSGSLRASDLVFRYGGDEIALVLPQTGPDAALLLCERIRLRVATEMQTWQADLTASMGISSWPGDGLCADELVRTADSALYSAKQRGRNQSVVFARVSKSPLEQTGNPPADDKAALSMVYALVAALGAKDNYTSRHSGLVATYSTALAEAAGLPAEDRAVIRSAALLHDVGKIGVPDELINRSGSLSPQEYDVVKTHSVAGYNIISHVPSLSRCLPAVLHHHERYDGTGYPRGLKGETIPVSARILAISDAFAAMISARPYSPALTFKEAIQQLQTGAGRQFDPGLVGLFIPIALSISPEDAARTSLPEMLDHGSK
jgi:diguanylate cyclase (GGDEF)-like protein/putative nucleotidyltransferase with HDIG domain